MAILHPHYSKSGCNSGRDDNGHRLKSADIVRLTYFLSWDGKKTGRPFPTWRPVNNVCVTISCHRLTAIILYRPPSHSSLNNAHGWITRVKISRDSDRRESTFGSFSCYKGTGKKHRNAVRQEGGAAGWAQSPEAQEP